ncbi:hypothetical protein FN846DRAFT_915143 [Sphaerosporella brunnea]|uniref:Uncharacterized protein n=1 Tax=Sphaerosporella brunnea TaxID=1250544 RepID=A0A5J5EAZ2_9PEZI|nr:hypothetical protein FN846DRAFT_915143 [Sphaerosporella brunnea]
MTTLYAFIVAQHNWARAAPIRYPGFVNIDPNPSGCTNRRPDLTQSVGPRLDWRAPGLLGPLDDPAENVKESADETADETADERDDEYFYERFCDIDDDNFVSPPAQAL